MTFRPIMFMRVFTIVVITAVVLYYVFIAVNTWSLENQQGTATVTGKEYRKPGLTYQRQPIGGRIQTLPRTTPEMYILNLEINGKKTAVAVTEEIYDRVHNGERVGVTYEARRITGTLQVLDVMP